MCLTTHPRLEANERILLLRPRAGVVVAPENPVMVNLLTVLAPVMKEERIWKMGGAGIVIAREGRILLSDTGFSLGYSWLPYTHHVWYHESLLVRNYKWAEPGMIGVHVPSGTVT